MDRDPDDRRASLGASDADREQFVEALRQHHAAGRLTTEELTERTERAEGRHRPDLRRPGRAGRRPAADPATIRRPGAGEHPGRARAGLAEGQQAGQ
jgi:hypothetical protein